ncbi:MAG: VanW family protein [Clostridia bacterium]|nr:VanW family protein [Clostridia bacterium]
MSTRKEKKLNIVLGACAGVLVLAGGLCVLLLGGEDKGAQLVQATPETTMTPVPTATEIPQANIVVSTPEVDLVAEKHRQEMEAIAIRNIMLPGTTIYGVNVGGMSRDEAKAAVEERLVRDPLIVNLQLSDGTNLYPASGEGIDTLLASTKVAQEEEEDDDAVDPAMKAAEAAGDPEPEPETTDPTDAESIGIRLNIDVDKAVTEAFSLMRDMNVPYDTFMLQVQQIASGKDVAPVPGYDIDSVNRFIEYLSEFLDTPAVNSSITMKDNQIVYTLEAIGQGIDREALVETILNTDPLSGKTISIPIHDLEPTITQEMLQSKFVLRGSYTTSFSDSTKNRKYNIRFGAEKINGIILKPGDVFSANDTLGTRTRKNGWKNAGAYESGEVVQQAGGGVCQLSSTLYNAALYADMEIVERRNHSMPVHYVDRGRDATINSVGNIIDFKFRNNTSSDVIIMAYTDGNILHMEIYGVPFETDEYDRIEIRTKQRGSVSIKTVYEYDDSKPASYSKTITKGSKGYTVQTYKDYYLGQTLVKTDDLGISKYTMFPKKVLVGTIEESSSDDDSGAVG